MGIVRNRINKVINIDIGQRIAEILEEKRISPNSFSRKIGMAKSTFYNCIHGERIFKVSELELIALHLKMTVQRIKQEDTRTDLKMLTEMLKENTNLKRALDVANDLIAVAVGATERSRALNDLGRVYYSLRKYDEAHTAWLEAYKLSEKVVERYGDIQMFYLVLSNLMISFTLRKEYSNALEILAKVEPIFKDNPKVLGDIHFTRAVIEENSGNIEAAKKHSYTALECYEKFGDCQVLVRAEVNAAHFEYKLRNYVASQKMLEHAMSRNFTDPYLRLFLIKEYVKTLLKLKQFSSARNVIQDTFNEWKDSLAEFKELRDKMLLLQSVAHNDPSYAEQLLLSDEVIRDIRQFAFVFLRSYCIRMGDEKLLMKYSRIAYQFVKVEDVLDEGEL